MRKEQVTQRVTAGKCRSCCIQIFGISLTHIFPSHPRRLATPPPQEPTVYYRYQMVTQYSIVCIVL